MLCFIPAVANFVLQRKKPCKKQGLYGTSIVIKPQLRIDFPLAFDFHDHATIWRQAVDELPGF
jgi:hypothetical protein